MNFRPMMQKRPAFSLIIGFLTFIAKIDCDKKNAKLDFFLFDLDDDEVRIRNMNDTRSYNWLSTSCNFQSNSGCHFGSMEKKWSVLDGSSSQSIKDGGPDYPAIGFWSDKRESATLYSDPIYCLEKDTGRIKLKLWAKGRWSFQICFINLEDGTVVSCGTVMSSSNFKLHRLSLDEPFPDYVYDYRNGPMVIALYSVVDNGVVLLDDISFSGVQCTLQNRPPIEWVDFKQYALADPIVLNELLAPIVRRKFKIYLSTIMELHGDNLRNSGQYGHVCQKLPCLSTSEDCFYDGSLGTVEWKLEKRGLSGQQNQAQATTQFVAKFEPNKLGYAILTSSAVSDNPYGDEQTRWMQIYGPITINFYYNQAAFNSKLLVCFYSIDQHKNRCDCELVKKLPRHAANNWNNVNVNAVLKDTYKIQIIAIQENLKSANQSSEVIIRDIVVLTCHDRSKIY